MGVKRETIGMDVVSCPLREWVGSLVIDYTCDDTTIMLIQCSSDHNAARWHHISAKQCYKFGFAS